MSILKYLFDNEWLQRHDIEHIHDRMVRQSATGRLHNQQLRARIAALENEQAELTLLVRSLYVYLKRNHHFDSAKFAAIIKEIDEQDGVRDGKVTKPKTKPTGTSHPRRTR